MQNLLLKVISLLIIVLVLKIFLIGDPANSAKPDFILLHSLSAILLMMLGLKIFPKKGKKPNG